MEMLGALIKEVFAQFGAAYYHSEVLYRGLCNAYALATFEEVDDITRPRVEEKLALASSLTLGQLLVRLSSVLPCELQQRLEVALDKRNYLAHRFWFERCAMLVSEQGLLELRQELLELTDVFSEMDGALSEHFAPKRRAWGLTDELIQEEYDRLIAGETVEPLVRQRMPRKQERVVRIWDVRLGVDPFPLAQIAETEDGCLWQFCDVGLGWTHFEKPAPDWAINERLQEFLPATINPRPPIAEPWTYEFSLARGAVLCVKRGRRDRTYSWGIKAPAKA